MLSPPGCATCSRCCAPSGRGGIEFRLHDTSVYSSIFRSDDDLIVSMHPCPVAGSNAPTARLRRVPSGDMVASTEREIGILAHAALFRPLPHTDGVQVRQHKTIQYNSIFRADDELLINPHVHGIATAYAPVLHLRHAEPGGMFTTYTDSFERVWTGATPITAPKAA